MNKIIGIGADCKDKKTKHRMEIEVEFAEPCTQFEAQHIVLGAISELLYNYKGGGSDETD